MKIGRILSSSLLLLTAVTVLSLQKIDTSKWQTFKGKSGSYAIKCPEGWGLADPTDPAMIKARDEMLARNPALAKAVKNPTNDYDLMLIDYSSDPGKTVRNMNVKYAKDSGLTTKMYPDLAKQILGQLTLKKSGWKVIKLPSGESLTYWGQMTVEAAEGVSFETLITGYITVKGRNLYISTFTGTGADHEGSR
ncbi:MAG: hypothetical protein ABL962_19050 [Fimbriimonadaceae bacterium]